LAWTLIVINPQADYLFVSDQNAIQYILASGYNFQKIPERREISRIHSGRGIIWADGKRISIIRQYPIPGPQLFLGETHRRHKRIILPGFSGPAVKACTPIFFAYASKVWAY